MKEERIGFKDLHPVLKVLVVYGTITMIWNVLVIVAAIVLTYAGII